MSAIIKKLRKLYKGSYYYANKKYGKYTKRRPFPNFADFDCSPSGEFSVDNNDDINYYLDNPNRNKTIRIDETGNKIYITNSYENQRYYNNNAIYANGINENNTLGNNKSLNITSNVTPYPNTTTTSSMHSNNESDSYSGNTITVGNPFYDPYSGVSANTINKNRMTNSSSSSSSTLYSQFTTNTNSNTNYNNNNDMKSNAGGSNVGYSDFSNNYNFTSNVYPSPKDSTMVNIDNSLSADKKKKWWKITSSKNKNSNSNDHTNYSSDIEKKRKRESTNYPQNIYYTTTTTTY